MLDLTHDDFTKTVFVANEPFFVEFGAEWCSDYTELHSLVKQLEREYRQKIKFAKVNVDQNPDLANQFKIEQVPTFLIFKNQKVVDRVVGLEYINHFKRKLDKIIM